MGNRIRELREERGWSQRDLADRLEPPVSEIAAIEVGQDEPGVAAALRLAKAFDRPVDELFGAERERDRLERDGWTFCGDWLNTFHYFKRAG